MAKSVHNIAISLTADMQKGLNELRNVENRIMELNRAKRMLDKQGLDTTAVDVEIKALKELQAELARTAGFAKKASNDLSAFGDNAHNKAIRGNGRMSQAFGQLSFAVEDFLTVYGNTGLQGAMVASGNNFSMVARILSGPLLGGLVGVGAIMLPQVVKMFQESEKATESFADELGRVIGTLMRTQ